MTTKPFPDDAQRRRTIVVLDQSDIDRCGFEDGGPALLLNEEIHVLESPVRDPQGIIRDLLERGLVQRGAILAQSPFDKDRYEDAEQAEELFALAKHTHFSTFCLHLGAREVKIEQIQRRRMNKTLTWTYEGGAKLKMVNASLDALSQQDECDDLISRLTLVDTFEGGQANLEAAEKLLRQTGLLGDPNMSGLLDMRRPGSNHNQLKSRTLKLNLSSEAKRNLTVIRNLQLPLFIKLKADYTSVIHEQAEYTLTITVCF